MRDMFNGYIPYTEDEFKQLWDEATIVLDANVLLNLYRYSKSTQEQMLKTLDEYKDRIWLPHQAAKEFMRNRKNTISDQLAIYDKLAKKLCESDSRKKIFNEISRHLHIDFAELKSIVADSEKVRNEKIKDYLKTMKDKEDDYFSNDSTMSTILDLFEGKTGRAFSDAEYKNACDEAKERYKYEIPPGYEDLKDKSDDYKNPSNAYGDYVFWKQVMNYASDISSVKSVIIITDDGKDDWWHKRNNKVIGPWPEMIQEFFNETGKKVWLYKSDSFLKYASSREIKDETPKSEEERKVIDEAINEISKIAVDVVRPMKIRDVLTMKGLAVGVNLDSLEGPGCIQIHSLSDRETYIIEIRTNWLPSYAIDEILYTMKSNANIDVISHGTDDRLFPPEFWIHLRTDMSKKKLSFVVDDAVKSHLVGTDYDIAIKQGYEIDH